MADGWWLRGACRGVDPAIFYPDEDRRTVVTKKEREAKCICSQCPVKRECLLDAISRDEPGIWGGMNSKERRAYARRYMQ